MALTLDVTRASLADHVVSDGLYHDMVGVDALWVAAPMAGVLAHTGSHSPGGAECQNVDQEADLLPLEHALHLRVVVGVGGLARDPASVVAVRTLGGEERAAEPLGSSSHADLVVGNASAHDGKK